MMCGTFPDITATAIIVNSVKLIADRLIHSVKSSQGSCDSYGRVGVRFPIGRA